MFAGRNHELTAIAEAHAEGRRVVTLLGTGGIGKTRLAREYAARSATANPDRNHSCFVDLSGARSVGSFVTSVGSALGVDLGKDNSIRQLGGALAGQGNRLLVLDNVEQIAELAAGAVAVWRELAPRLMVLVTSRTALGLRGEQQIVVPPLELAEGAALFEARARETDYEFRIATNDRQALHEILRRIDCIPLAIELAAARVSVLSLPELGKRLAAGLRVLRSTKRDLPARHCTLAATIEWSWSLLSAHERSALLQCSVFRGAFSLDAAEAVVQLPTTDGMSVLDVLQALLEKSLLHRVDDRESDGGRRFRLYAPVQELAAAKSAASRQDAEPVARHTQYCLDIARALPPFNAAYGACDPAALARAWLELDNLLAAFARTEHTDPNTAARIGLAIVSSLYVRGPGELNLTIVDAAAAAAGRAANPELHCTLMVLQGASRRQWGWEGDPGPDIAIALERSRQIGDAACEGAALYYLGMVNADRKDVAAARRFLEQSIACAEAAGDTLRVGMALSGLGLVCFQSDQFDAAIDSYTRGLDLNRQIENRRWQAICLRNRAIVFYLTDRLEDARRDSEQALVMQRELRDPHRFLTLCIIAVCRARIGDMAGAWQHTLEALDAARSGDVPPSLAQTYSVTTWLHMLDGSFADAESIATEGLQRIPAEHRSTSRMHAQLARGVARLFAGRRDAARNDLSEVLARCSAASGMARDKCMCLAFLAALEAFDGRIDRARELFAAARTESERQPNRRHERFVDILESSVSGTAPPDVSSIEYPLMEEIVAARLTAAWGNQRPVAMRVGHDVRWLETPSGHRIDLARRPTLRRLAGALVSARRSKPGVSVPAATLIEHTWPSDRSAGASLNNRLWVALNKLRQLGLREFLANDEDGYCLDPRVELVDVPPNKATSRMRREA